MNMSSVPFALPLPLRGPVSLELYGVRSTIPMQQAGEAWTVAVDLAPGAYPYRFRVGNSVLLGDARRTTERVIDGDVWSVLHVTGADGPVWVERVLPKVAAVQICRGLSETDMPLMVLERVHQADLPVILWAQIEHLYRDALLRVFLVRPDGELAFGGEFALESSKASADFDLKFWLSLNVEPEQAASGVWTFLVQAEGGPLIPRQISLALS